MMILATLLLSSCFWTKFSQTQSQTESVTKSEDPMEQILEEGKIWLAFYGGPTTYTPELLAFLKDQKIRGLHFLVGERILNQPQILNDFVNQDQDVGNGTFTLPSELFARLALEKQIAEILHTQRLLGDYALSLFFTPGASWQPSQKLFQRIQKRDQRKEFPSRGPLVWQVGNRGTEVSGNWHCLDTGQTPEGCAKEYFRDLFALKTKSGILLFEDNANTVSVLKHLFPKIPDFTFGDFREILDFLGSLGVPSWSRTTKSPERDRVMPCWKPVFPPERSDAFSYQVVYGTDPDKLELFKENEGFGYDLSFDKKEKIWSGAVFFEEDQKPGEVSFQKDSESDLKIQGKFERPGKKENFPWQAVWSCHFFQGTYLKDQEKKAFRIQFRHFPETSSKP